MTILFEKKLSIGFAVHDFCASSSIHECVLLSILVLRIGRGILRISS